VIREMKEMKQKNILGCKVKDRITGFEGIVAARVIYLNGCVQYCVTPKLAKDEKMSSGEYIDVGQLEFVDEGIRKPSKEIGGVMPNKPKY